MNKTATDSCDSSILKAATCSCMITMNTECIKCNKRL